MKWVTREEARVDRIAWPWLISRFIDRDPTFQFVPKDQVLSVDERERGIRDDMPGVGLGHHRERCSFDAFLPGVRRVVRLLPLNDEVNRAASRSAAK